MLGNYIVITDSEVVQLQMYWLFYGNLRQDFGDQGWDGWILAQGAAESVQSGDPGRSRYLHVRRKTVNATWPNHGRGDAHRARYPSLQGLVSCADPRSITKEFHNGTRGPKQKSMRLKMVQASEG